MLLMPLTAAKMLLLVDDRCRHSLPQPPLLPPLSNVELTVAALLLLPLLPLTAAATSAAAATAAAATATAI